MRNIWAPASFIWIREREKKFTKRSTFLTILLFCNFMSSITYPKRMKGSNKCISWNSFHTSCLCRTVITFDTYGSALEYKVHSNTFRGRGVLFSSYMMEVISSFPFFFFLTCWSGQPTLSYGNNIKRWLITIIMLPEPSLLVRCCVGPMKSQQAC